MAFDRKMRADEVEAQLRAYVDQKAIERTDEVASGTIRKLRFEQSIEKLPETFFDLSPYKKRVIGVGDCAAISLGVAEGDTYSAAVAVTSDITQDGGGIRTIDYQSFLLDRHFVREPVEDSITLESLWHSDLIGVSDSGIIMVSGEGDGQSHHAIGFRNAKMIVSDPILTTQLYASAEVFGVYLKKSNDAAAIARAIKRQAAQMPVSFSQQTPMTHEDLENLKARLTNEIVSNIASQLGIQQVYG